MKINWFEGGRRAVSLVAVLILAGAAIFVFFGGSANRIVLETLSPSDRLHWTLQECSYPDFDKPWDGPTELKQGDPRPITACFRAGKNGKIPYALGPEQSITTKINGKDLPIQLRPMIYGDQYDDEVRTYALARMNQFKFTAAESQAIADGQWKIGVLRFCERTEDAFPWVAGLLIGLWVIAAGIGWLIRGFAGVPNGQDFRSDENNKAALKTRASLEWLLTAIGFWALVSGIAWVVTKALTPTTTLLGKIAGKIIHWFGVISLGMIGVGIFFAGGWAFRVLIYAALKRSEPKTSGEDKALLGFALANGAFVLIVLALLGTYTVVGQWGDALYRWGFANGLQDGVQMGACALCLLWPFVPLLVMSRFQARKINNPAIE